MELQGAVRRSASKQISITEVLKVQMLHLINLYNG